MKPHVTIVIVSYNSALHIEECLLSMLNQSYTNYELLIIDSNSSDNTLAIVSTKFPSIQLIASAENLGYRRGNRLGMRMAKGDYVVVCNDDVVVDYRWLEEMVTVMEGDPQIGMATPRILLHNNPSLMNAAGNTFHFSGIYGPRAKYEPVEKYINSEHIGAVSGCCFIIRTHLIKETGGFSEDYDVAPPIWHAGYEELELCWNIQTRGYRIQYIASSIMYHKYKLPSRDNWRRFAGRTYWHLLFILRNFDTNALLFLAPVHLFIETLWFCLALLKGPKWVKAKVDAWWWFIKNHRELRQMRRAIFALPERKTYWDILPYMDANIKVVSATVEHPVARLGDAVVNTVFLLYYQFMMMIRKFYAKKSLAA